MKITATFLGLLAVTAATAQAAPLPPSGTLDLTSAPAGAAATWKGSEAGGLAGAAVAGIGDFDGDGKGDVAVGEPKRDSAAGKDAGAVRILVDAKTGGELEKATTITGAAPGDYAGFDVAPAGDVNADGLADLLVGAPLANGAAGAAYLVYGRRGATTIDLAGEFGGVRITGAEAGSQLGRSVASLPDVSGDGKPELLVGAPFRDVGERRDAGSAYVVFGTTAPAVDVATADGYRVDGPTSKDGALAGRALGSIGDLNGDGRPELLLTAPRAGAGGKAYVLWGRTTAGVIDLDTVGEQGYTITSPVAGGWIGESIAAVGDVSGDGKPDLAVGSHLASGPDRKGAGLAYVLFGKSTTAPVDTGRLGTGGYRITGVGADDQTGFVTAPAGDFNADGVPDVAVSAPLADPLSRETAGAVYVVYGRRGEQTDLDLAEIGERGIRIAGGEGQTTGFAVDAVGDVDGDGGGDLAIGSVAIASDYLQSLRATAPGSVSIVFGAAGRPGDVPGAEVKQDPGYDESVAAGCVPVTNVQAVVEDNGYTDRAADRERIRLDGLQTYVATPRNAGTVLGVSGFPSGAGSVPLLQPTELLPQRVDGLKKTLFAGIDGEDDFPGYAEMFTTLADDNPSAGARIMVVDGYLFRRLKGLDGLTDGSAPTYIIAIGEPPDRNGADINQMRRISRETKGRYYEARSARQLERALQAIQSRLRCDKTADDFQDELQVGEVAEIAETELDEGTYTADVTVSWRDDEDDYEIDHVDVIDDGNVVRRISAAAVRSSYSARGAGARVTGGRGRTFRALHIRGARGGTKLRVVIRAEGRRTSGRVYARVTQSRRRR